MAWHGKARPGVARQGEEGPRRRKAPGVERFTGVFVSVGGVRERPVFVGIRDGRFPNRPYGLAASQA